MTDNDNADRRMSLCARLSSVERSGPWELPRELELRAFWGNLELDLREATFVPGTTTIEVNVTMGNIELIVPPSIEVRLEPTTFAASVEQNGTTTVAPASDGTKRVLRIVGRVRFGNLEVIPLWPGESRRDAWRRHLERHGHHGRGWHADAISGRVSRNAEQCAKEMRDAACDAERDAHDAAVDAAAHGRDAELLERYERYAERDARDAVRAEGGAEGTPHGPRVRKKALRDERRRGRHRRWRELHAERDLWRRSRDRGGPWKPWWLMARMRRRIFLWLAIALGGGIAIGWRLTEQPRWWWIAIAVVVLSMISGAIAFRLTRPLIMVVKAAREIGDGKLDTRLEVEHHGGETRVLAAAINDMAEKIEQQIADQRQLLAAVSHELRTPLGHMRVLVETARSATPSDDASVARVATSINTGASTGADTTGADTTGVGSTDAGMTGAGTTGAGMTGAGSTGAGMAGADMAGASATSAANAASAKFAAGNAAVATKALAEIEREILVLDDLVGKLLAQSRLEFGNLERRPIDLGELVTDAATSAGVTPEAIEASENVKAAVDPTLVRRAIANLLDNARVHGGGVLAVRIERRAGQIVIEVDDAGPGVAKDRRAEAFRAFGPSTGGGGLGLGLALVSRIAVAHGGGAWIDDRPGGGARVGFAVQA